MSSHCDKKEHYAQDCGVGHCLNERTNGTVILDIKTALLGLKSESKIREQSSP